MVSAESGGEAGEQGEQTDDVTVDEHDKQGSEQTDDEHEPGDESGDDQIEAETMRMQTGDIDAAGYLANYVKRKASQELSSLSSTVMFNAKSYKKQPNDLHLW